MLPSAKLGITCVICLLLFMPDKVLADTSGAQASSAHENSAAKANSEGNECYGKIKKNPYKALLCYETIDPTLKILLKKDGDGNALYENLIKACGHEYLAGIVTAKELGICRKKLTVLDKYARLP